MLKKILLTCAIVIPTILITTYLVTNKPTEEITTPLKEKIVLIEGMYCNGCTKTISDAIKTCNGVKTVSINYDTKEAKIQYNPELCSLKDIKKKITEAGYTPKAKDQLKIVDFKIKYN